MRKQPTSSPRCEHIGETDHRPQPYKQLARTLRETGQERDATIIEIAKEKARRTYFIRTKETLSRDAIAKGRPLRALAQGMFAIARRAESFVLCITIGYGYRPWRLASFAAALWLFGCYIFANGYQAGYVAPTQEKAALAFAQGVCSPPHYQSFNSAIFSLESLVPVIRLEQSEFWLPVTQRSGPCARPILTTIFGRRVAVSEALAAATRAYMWIHIGFGWVLVLLLTTAVTALVRRE